MQKCGKLLVFVCSLVLMFVCAVIIYKTNLAFSLISHAHLGAPVSVGTVEGIIAEYTLVLVLGSLLLLTGAVVALISGISLLLPKKRDNSIDRD